MKRGLGQWQAYVEAGRSREERNERLAEVPEDMRERVREHVRDVFRLRALANLARGRVTHEPDHRD